jgi:hypothetical protein
MTARRSDHSGKLRAENADLRSRLAESKRETRVLFQVVMAYSMYGMNWPGHRPSLYRIYDRTFPR